MVKVITGLRRCGKSFLLFTIYKDYLISQGIPQSRIIEIALDNPEFMHLRDPLVLYDYIKEKITGREMHYIFIDEIQMVAKYVNPALKKDGDYDETDYISFYDVLNGLLHMDNTDVYVTGSNSKMLSKDIWTQFRGRGDQIHVFPLTFREFYTYRKGDRYDAFNEYLLYGGMPYILSLSSGKEKKQYLENLFEEVYFKDVVSRYTIEYTNVLRGLTEVLCSTTGSLTNASKISRTLKSTQNISVDSETISKYLQHLTESFLYSEAKRYDVKGRKYFSYPSKYYATDPGLRNARLNFRQFDAAHLVETVVFNELLARGHSVDVGYVETTERNQEGIKKRVVREIDFVVNASNPGTKYFIQVAESIDSPEKMEQELRPFQKMGADSNKKILISRSSMLSWTDEEGICHVNIFDFLLDENSI
ncbi:MAG TPA: ATP-binding protein [Methanocorpusculum sp.]|nr:ATP-binding protein [Methanocorpusculum sp.]